jgi:hypothetical protein
MIKIGIKCCGKVSNDRLLVFTLSGEVWSKYEKGERRGGG